MDKRGALSPGNEGRETESRAWLQNFAATATSFAKSTCAGSVFG